MLGVDQATLGEELEETCAVLVLPAVLTAHPKPRREFRSSWGEWAEAHLRTATCSYFLFRDCIREAAARCGLAGHPGLAKVAAALGSLSWKELHWLLGAWAGPGLGWKGEAWVLFVHECPCMEGVKSCPFAVAKPSLGPGIGLQSLQALDLCFHCQPPTYLRISRLLVCNPCAIFIPFSALAPYLSSHSLSFSLQMASVFSKAEGYTPLTGFPLSLKEKVQKVMTHFGRLLHTAPPSWRDRADLALGITLS